MSVQLQDGRNTKFNFKHSIITGVKGEYIGGIVGKAKSLKIDDVILTNLNIQANESRNVGGVTGGLYGKSLIKNVAAKLEITSSGSNIGGLVGFMSEESSISESHSKGKIHSQSAHRGRCKNHKIYHQRRDKMMCFGKFSFN